MVVRYALEKDIDQIKKIWNGCFDENTRFENWTFEQRFQPDKCLVAVDKDRGKNEIIGAVQYSPLTLALSGTGLTKMECDYVYDLSVAPEYQNQGIGRRLMEGMHAISRSHGKQANIVLPVSSEYYHKLGYDFITEKSEYVIDQPIVSEAYPCQINAIDATVMNLSTLSLVYQQRCYQHGCYIKRSMQDFERILKLAQELGGGIKIIYDGMIPAGYFVWTREEDCVAVKELIYLEDQAAEVIQSMQAVCPKLKIYGTEQDERIFSFAKKYTRHSLMVHWLDEPVELRDIFINLIGWEKVQTK